MFVAVVKLYWKEKLQKKGIAQFKNDRITAWDQVQLKIKIKLGNIFLWNLKLRETPVY